MFKRLFKKNVQLSFLIITVVFSSVVFPTRIFAATLSLVPSASTVSVGNIVTLKISLSTSGKYINNADGIILFPADVLDVISVSKSSSVFSLWVEEPQFSNSLGKITFNGGVANPGYNGNNGTVATIVFKAKKAGSASIVFSDGAVRENDGLGTNILSSKNGTTLSVTSAQPVDTVPVQNPPSQTTSLSKPIITSDTHPDQNQWYKATTVSLSWKIPSNVASLKTLFDKTSNSTPTIAYDNSVSQKTISNISDGIYYFHLRFINGNEMSPVSHYVIKVDSTAPKPFEPTLLTSDNNVSVILNAEDVTSGIEYYTLKIDNQPLVKVPLDKIVDGKYELPYQTEGNHSLVVTAYDRAGNQTTTSTVFSSPAISTPKITLSSEEVHKGDTVIISGTTDYPDSLVEISLFNNDEEVGKYTQTTAKDGSFSIVSDKLKMTGVVAVSAVSVLGENVRSQQSEKIYLTVSETQFEKTSLALIGLIIIVLLLLILLVVVYIGWHRFFGLKRRMNRELLKAVKDIHETTVTFKAELESQLDALEKIREDRVLNKKEEAIFMKIKKNIDDIDRFIEKKLKKLM